MLCAANKKRVTHHDEEEGGRGGCSQFLHDRCLDTSDLRIPTMPGRSTPGFHQPLGGGWRTYYEAYPLGRQVKVSAISGRPLMVLAYASLKYFGAIQSTAIVDKRVDVIRRATQFHRHCRTQRRKFQQALSRTPRCMRTPPEFRNADCRDGSISYL